MLPEAVRSSTQTQSASRFSPGLFSQSSDIFCIQHMHKYLGVVQGLEELGAGLWGTFQAHIS